MYALREEDDILENQTGQWPRYFYPRPPRGGRPRMRSTSWRSTYFYPRPPRGGRLKTDEACLDIKAFLSTPSARRATDVAAAGHDLDAISIHALREEGDREPTPRTEAMQFLSTPSARRATPPARKRAPQKKFLSTPSARRATPQIGRASCRERV